MAPLNRPQEIQIIRGRDTTITADGRAYPLMVVSTAGDLEVDAYNEFFDWRTQWTDFASANQQKIVVIALNETMKPPSATVRKHIAEKVKDDDKIDGLLCVYMVVPNAVLRGIVTAVMWVAGSSEKVKNTATFADAVQASRRILSEHGFTHPPFDCETYVVPT